MPNPSALLDAYSIPGGQVVCVWRRLGPVRIRASEWDAYAAVHLLPQAQALPRRPA